MGVPEGKRREDRLEVYDLARAMAVHTLDITRNRRVFPGRYEKVVNGINGVAWEIPRNLWLANNTKVGPGQPPENLAVRRRHQQTAMSYINELLFEIEMCEMVFGGKRDDDSDEKKLSRRRISYWSGLVVQVKEMARAWIKSDIRRFGQPESPRG